MINENELPEIPRDSKRIWLAHICGDIIRIKYNKTIRDKFSFADVYKDDEEKNESSYFMNMLRIRLKLEKQNESFTITSIERIKYIGFSLPDVQ